MDCVILDDGGFLLMSNQEDYITQVKSFAILIHFYCMCNCRQKVFLCLVVLAHVQIGQFFGEVDPVLMITLVNISLYSFNKTYDYQSVCDPERETKAAAGPRSVYVVRANVDNVEMKSF